MCLLGAPWDEQCCWLSWEVGMECGKSHILSCLQLSEVCSFKWSKRSQDGAIFAKPLCKLGNADQEESRDLLTLM